MALRDDALAPTTTTASTTARTVEMFIRLWAMANLIHLTADGARLDSIWNVTATAAGIALLLRPGRGALFALMAVAQIGDTVNELPLSPDHWMLVALVNLAFLLTMLRRRAWDADTLAAAFPAARLLLLLGYGAAALAKYNSAFLDPVASCARAIADRASFGLSERLDIAPVWAVVALAVETSIPLLLAVPWTRRHWVRVGMVFHFFLSASPTFAMLDFTAALFALFFLFLPERDVEKVADRLTWVAARSAVVRDARRVPALTAVVGFAVFGFVGYVSSAFAVALVFVVSDVYLLVMVLVALTSWPAGGGGTRPFGRLILLQVPAVFLLVLWAAQPYLGGRTTGVFTMFSGIKTEAHMENHLFMPTHRLVDWQNDMVVIESSNSPLFDDVSPGRMAVPLLALRRLAMDEPNLQVVGTLHDRRLAFGPKPGQRALDPLPYWQYKWLLFRPVAVGEPGYCTMG